VSIAAEAGAVALDEPADPGAAASNRRRRSLIGRNQAMTAGSFLLPNMILVALFLLAPLVGTIVISSQRLGSLGGAQFLGINNYTDLFQDRTFYETLWNTALFTVVTVPVSMGLGLGIACLLNGVLPGRNLYRSIIFLPLVISSVSIGLLGSWMFDQDNGFVNKFLHLFGIGAVSWNSDGTWALASVMIVTVWQRVGFAMLIYLAGLQGVDPGVLEAATVDGASPWQRFRRITFPLLGPSTFFLLVMNLIYSFQVFDTVYAMTAGGPNYSTTTIVTYAYRIGFDDHGPQQLGYAAAIGVVIYLITLGITTLQFKLSKQNDAVG
jgi:multiple sugar transport system permease protein